MSNERVKPLFEDASASPELRNFVAMARADGPNQSELDGLARRLAPVLGVSAGLAVASQAAAFGSPPSSVLTGLGSAATSAGGSVAPAAAVVKGGLLGQLLASTSAKVVAIGLSMGVAGVGAWELQKPEPRAPGPQVPATAQVNSMQAAPVHAAPSRAPAPSLEPAPAMAAPVDLPQPVAPAPAASSTTTFEATPAVARVRRTALVPAVRPVAVDPRLVTAQPAAPVAVEPAQPLTSELPAPPPPSELSLIRRAQAHGSDAEALALIAQHEHLYPHGVLAQEREMLAIELLLKAGSTPQAQLRARRFELAYAGSAHLPHLRALLQRAGAR